MTQLTEHFSEEEMACPCCGACEMDLHFMERLEQLRLRLNCPLAVNSAYRCLSHNASLADSAPDSLHLYGKASDVQWVQDKHRMLSLSLIMFHGLGIGGTYLHMDLGGEKKVWIY